MYMYHQCRGGTGGPTVHAPHSRFTCTGTDRPWKSQRLKIIIVNIIGNIVLIIEKVCARPFLFHVLLRALLVDSAKKKKTGGVKILGERYADNQALLDVTSEVVPPPSARICTSTPLSSTG